uniref:Uncharacterized protein n=1 Tax=Pristionchus pacificus TaxID=54126 RepID=A0A2A6CW96_PRIPA|eukprot:PDM82356.1 hypothetical protein PRIPAC_36749 [Pristionchus pacificus]
MPDIGMDNEMKATLETNNEWEHTKQEQDSGTDSRLIGKVARERIKQGYEAGNAYPADIGQDKNTSKAIDAFETERKSDRRRNLHRKELVIKVDTQVSNIYKDLIEIRMEFTNNQGYVYINKSTELVVKDENKKILYRLSAPV